MAALATATLVSACAVVGGIRERELVDPPPVTIVDAGDHDAVDAAPDTEAVVPAIVAEGLRATRFAVDPSAVFALDRMPSRISRILRIDRGTGATTVVAIGRDQGAMSATELAITPRHVYWATRYTRELWWRTKDLGIPVQSSVDNYPGRTTTIDGFWNTTASGRLYFRRVSDTLGVFDETGGFDVSEIAGLSIAAGDGDRVFAVTLRGQLMTGTVTALQEVASYSRIGSHVLDAPALDERRLYWFDGSGVPGETGRIFAATREGGAPTPILEDVRSPCRLATDGETLFILSLGHLGDDRPPTEGELRTCRADACAASVRTARTGLRGAAWLVLERDDVFWSELHEDGAGVIVRLAKRDL